MKALRDLLLSHSNRVIYNSLLLLFALNVLPNGAPSPLICTKATVNWRCEADTSSTLATIDKLVLITDHALSLLFTQMSVMPEAASALFMSQFSDEEVRDAIARVSLFSTRCKQRQQRCNMNVFLFNIAQAGYLHEPKICLSKRCCVFRMKFFFLLAEQSVALNLFFPARLPRSPSSASGSFKAPPPNLFL